MPRGDGTGPFGQGPGTGRGQRRGTGRSAIAGGRPGMGPVGNCICSNCGTKVPHQPGNPCTQLICPKCGGGMVRE